MADEEHVALLKQGVEVWNKWREKNRDIKPNLNEADLSGADLDRANLGGANLGDAILRRANLGGAILSGAILSGAILGGAILRRAILSGANLGGADMGGAILNGADIGGAILRRADLGGAILSGANLRRADLGDANLNGAKLNGADLGDAILNGASLSGADLSGATLFETLFVNTNLTRAKGLETCQHLAPSTIDHRTLQRSGPLPLAFLRGVGLPDNLIDYLPSLLNQPRQFFSCFISYSSKDQEFADRLHADLQNKGVRCWFAPHDMSWGAKTWDAIDEAIRLRDKVLLILSRNAIESDWVEDEVTKAFAEELARKQLVLFPVRLDDAVIKTTEAWAGKLRGNRNIGDFRRWKDHDAYQKALERVLRDLQVAQAGPP
jgi:uncharacterized protein YjbI with pentapeptide repeats